MAALRAAKQALRKEMKRRVAALSDEEKRRQSRVVSQKLFRHPKYVSSKRIALFLSMNDEVLTEEIVKDAFKWGKSCFIPRYESTCSHMDMLQLASLQDMETLPLTAWNIRQPAEDDNSREEALAAVPRQEPLRQNTLLIDPCRRKDLNPQAFNRVDCRPIRTWSTAHHRQSLVFYWTAVLCLLLL
ncbi:putative 5-formyltetrahydrofolate cyclo-ligase [Scophthalmus maximus]|uniref:5-formyltetrahydrofolate cyclo-ligase n=1 Tax=Scophthalmus maximus TaxID=52904 RepID=A0A2U9BEK5_SCOMX|nr:putative 5-formyltetrahydrofolate cyclo-ligase [Scophthalmus maximus]